MGQSCSLFFANALQYASRKGGVAFLSAIGRLNKDEKRDSLGDSAPWTAIPQLIENTIDMLWIEWQGSVLTN
jgi:hypothetical protein